MDVMFLKSFCSIGVSPCRLWLFARPQQSMWQCELIEPVKTSVMESAPVACASSIRTEQHRNQQKCRGNMNMIYECGMFFV